MKKYHINTMKNFWARPVAFIASLYTYPWMRKHEGLIYAKGRPLTESEAAWAERVGVTNLADLRVLTVADVPTPTSSGLPAKLARFMDLPSGGPLGMTVGHSIYLDESAAANEWILAHELAHVAQYEELGGIWFFINEYVRQCFANGMNNAALEKEADDKANQLFPEGS